MKSEQSLLIFFLIFIIIRHEEPPTSWGWLSSSAVSLVFGLCNSSDLVHLTIEFWFLSSSLSALVTLTLCQLANARAHFSYPAWTLITTSDYISITHVTTVTTVTNDTNVKLNIYDLLRWYLNIFVKVLGILLFLISHSSLYLLQFKSLNRNSEIRGWEIRKEEDYIDDTVWIIVNIWKKYPIELRNMQLRNEGNARDVKSVCRNQWYIIIQPLVCFFASFYFLSTGE